MYVVVVSVISDYGSSAAQWTERNIMNQKLSKALMRMEKRDTAK